MGDEIMGKRFSLPMGLVSRHRAFIYGFAAMWVLLFHMDFHCPEGLIFAPLRWIKNTGNCGVDIFCLLSGMGLYRSFAKDEKVAAFYARRFSRVFLPAFIVIALNAALRSDGGIADYLGRISVLGYWAGAPVLWYAPFILTMYLIYPIFYHINKRASRGMRLVLACALIFPVAAKFAAPEWAAHVEHAISRVPAFVIGCMLAPRIKDETKINILWMPLLLLPYAALQLTGYRLAERYSYIFLAAFMIVALVKIAEAFTRGKLRRTAYKFMAFMGGMSLELYLLQERVMSWVKPMGNLGLEWNALKHDVVSLIFTVVLAAALKQLCNLLITQFARAEAPQPTDEG